MNIVYCIGNGFDIAQGLKTQYCDFYDQYTNRYPISISPSAKKLRKSIKSDYKTWADLEMGLGEYTINLNEDDHDEAYFDLSDSLREHLKNEERRFWPNATRKDEVIGDLVTPYKTLLERDAAEISSILDQRPSETIHINIISFNYTTTLEKIHPEHESVHICNLTNHNVYLDNIYHIHGTLDFAMIMGVNDSDQIRNEAFHNNPNICDVLVKPQSNEAIRSNNVVICEKLIAEADLIVIFGMSIGETDKLWWQLIGATLLRKNAKLIIFEHLDKPIDFTRAQKIGAKRKEVINRFISKINFRPDFIDIISSRIYVNFSTDFLAPHKN